MADHERILTFDGPEAVDEWKTVDDVVMGGRSVSHIDWVEGEAGPDRLESSGVVRFEGEVSLENDGGFCSARLVEGDRGVPGLRELVVVARGDGKRYKCTVRTTGTPDSASWRLPFETTADRWRPYRLPIEDFELWRRGSHLSADRVLDPAAMTSVGLLISDEQEGRFRIDLAGILGERDAQESG